MKFSKLHTGSVVEMCEDDTHLKTFIQGKVNSCGREDKDDPFFICDLGDIVKKWKKFHQWLPNVEPFYALKCNPDPTVVKLLANLGANFDCASKIEIKQILDMGVAPERIIFANPCKQTSFVKYAATNKVNMMTFDNEAELHKIMNHHPNAELVIRIRVNDSKSVCKLGLKYGVCPTQAAQLLETAKKLNLNVIGVSFHVGSGCFDASAFYDAVKLSKFVFDEAAKLGFNFHLLDVGGGFPGVDGESISFEETAQELTLAFSEFFPEESNVRIIAEPGRFFVASAFTSVCNVTSVREVKSSDEDIEGYMYYLNDGVYGSFNGILFEKAVPIPYALYDGNKPEYKCSVWGPTCDSVDCISKGVVLPKLNIAEWICFDNMGAYSIAASSKFNGFKRPIIMYMCRRQYWNVVVEDVCDQVDSVAMKKKQPHALPIEPLKAIILN